MSQQTAINAAAYRAACRTLYSGDTEHPPIRDEIAQAIADAVEAALAARTGGGRAAAAAMPPAVLDALAAAAHDLPPVCGQRLLDPRGEKACGWYAGHLDDGLPHEAGDRSVKWTTAADVRWADDVKWAPTLAETYRQGDGR